MTTAVLTGTDVRLRNSVIRELDWDPLVDDSAIGVAAREGVVTLTGFIGSYAGKLCAGRVAKRVRGVRAVANDITVRLTVERTDADIAADVAQALKPRPGIGERVQAAVHQGHVPGVRSILNYVEVSPNTTQRNVRRRIVRALHRNVDVDTRVVIPPEPIDLHDDEPLDDIY